MVALKSVLGLSAPHLHLSELPPTNAADSEPALLPTAVDVLGAVNECLLNALVKSEIASFRDAVIVESDKVTVSVVVAAVVLTVALAI